MGTASSHQKRHTGKAQKALMQEQGYKKFVPKLPYAYLTVKCHKDPIGSRFIVGVAADQHARNDGEELSIVKSYISPLQNRRHVVQQPYQCGSIRN